MNKNHIIMFTLFANSSNLSIGLGKTVTVKKESKDPQYAKVMV